MMPPPHPEKHTWPPATLAVGTAAYQSADPRLGLPVDPEPPPLPELPLLPSLLAEELPKPKETEADML